MQKMPRRKFLAWLSALFTSGCGGSNNGSPAQPVLLAPEPAPVIETPAPSPLPPTTLSAADIIRQENAKTAQDGVRGQWRIEDTDYAANCEIEGYASATSVNRGETIKLFVNTPEPNYTISIYRMGWYDGKGGRLVAGPIQRKGIQQPLPVHDPVTNLVECNWLDPYELSIPANPSDPTDWASGIYLAKLTAGTSGKQSYIVFVVRDDERPADFLFQASVTTYAAYNNWGGYNFYNDDSMNGQHAYKLSFNRPYSNPHQPCAGKGAGDFLGWEIQMLRFLEREGYGVTYSDNIAVATAPDRLLRHRAFLSVGHDEYWTRTMRDAIECARDKGVHCAFIGANAGYWQIRLEPDSNGEPDRTIVCYKDHTVTHDPVYPLDHTQSTLRWRDPGINRPEAALMGVMYDFNSVDLDMVMADTSHWICANTGLMNGDRLPGMLGYEVDRVDPASSPQDIQILAASPYAVDAEGKDIRHAHMTCYRHGSGAWVFATGSMQWNWGLDSLSPWGDRTLPAVKQMTRNVLNRFIEDAG